MPLFLLMFIVTAIEVVLIAKVGSLIGFWATFFIIIATAYVGSRMLGKQWRFVMGKLQALQSDPSDAMLEALVLLICGVLLVTPGFLTDIIGFLGLIPTTRARLIEIMRKNSGRVLRSGQFSMHSSFSSFNQTGQMGQTGSMGTQHRSANEDIIEGEFERKD